jgi:hypothetical protein
MDFGKFSLEKTQDLFQRYFEISPKQFDACVKELCSLGLLQIVIDNDETFIECISSKEIEHQVDSYLQTHNLIL